jgi:hypothetical protein
VKKRKKKVMSQEARMKISRTMTLRAQEKRAAKLKEQGFVETPQIVDIQGGPEYNAQILIKYDHLVTGAENLSVKILTNDPMSAIRIWTESNDIAIRELHYTPNRG